MVADQLPAKRTRLKDLLAKLGLGAVVSAMGAALGIALTSNWWTMAVTAVGWMAQTGAILLDPLLGLLIWVAVSPYAPFVHLNLSLGAGIPDLGLDRLSAGFFCIVLLAQVARRKRTLAPFTWLDGAVLAYAAALTLSSRTALRGTLTALQTIFDIHLVPLLIYFLAKNLVRDGRAMRAVVAALALIASYLVALIAYEHLTGNELFVLYGRVTEYGTNLTRVNSLLQNPAYIALALNLILPFLLREAFQTADVRRRWVFGLAVPVLLAAVISLYNRAGWLGALLVLFTSSLHYPRLRRWLLVALAIIVPVAAASWTVVRTSSLLAERLTYSLSVNYRLTALSAVWQLVSRQLLFGLGFGNFSILSLSEGLIAKFTVNYWVPTTHNSYLDVLASAGLSGLLPFLAVFALIAWECWRLHRQARDQSSIDGSMVSALTAAFLAFAVSIATFDIAAAPFCSMLFWLIVGSVLGSANWPTTWSNVSPQSKHPPATASGQGAAQEGALS